MIDARITSTIYYDLRSAVYIGEHRELDEVLHDLGITYTGWRTGLVADQVEIFGVDQLSIPDLPPIFLRVHPHIPLDT